jgi:hypothetical protein
MNYEKNIRISSNSQQSNSLDLEEEQRIKMKEALLKFSVLIFKF